MRKAKDKSPKSQRRHSLPSETPNAAKSKVPKSTTSSPRKTARKDDLLSTENLKTANELLKQIQKYRREAWLTCESETTSKEPSETKSEVTSKKPSEIPSQTKSQNSGVAIKEEVEPSAATQTVLAEVHKATKKGIRKRTKSHESVVRFADEPLEVIELRNRKIQKKEKILENLKLVASSKLVSQSFEERTARARTYSLPTLGRTRTLLRPNYPVKLVVHPYLNALYQDYSTNDYEDNPPPPPAPPDPPQRNQFDVGGAYSYNVLFPSSSEAARSTETRPFREHEPGDLLSNRRSIEKQKPAPTTREEPIPHSSIVSSLWSREPIPPYEVASFADSPPYIDNVELPKSPPLSPTTQVEWAHRSRQDIPYPNGLSYIPDTPNRPYIPENNVEILHHEVFGNVGTPEAPRRPTERNALFGSNQRPDEERRRARSVPSRHAHNTYTYLDLSPPSSPVRRRRRTQQPLLTSYQQFIPKFFTSCFDLSAAATMNEPVEHERKIIIEFCHLLEKSKQLFNGLRELPQYGHKQWQSYFGRTFDVYTKLWKFQQMHRTLLECKYGLKRWQIGEIASKIGQLYYHFYLRTSETSYLQEAHSFYNAIRARNYYTRASKDDKCELMVKNLRYYARFIVTSLLMRNLKLVKELLKELDYYIIEYGNTYDPEDQKEWKIVAEEVKAFIEAEAVMLVLHPDDTLMTLIHRLTALSTPPVERTPAMNLTLQEVLIVGSNASQVKFSELTMDMFRMLQTLEREPTGDVQHMYDESPRQRHVNPGSVNHKENNDSGSPHKYLLFKPTPNQIFMYLASACDDLPPNGVVLLYISAEGLIVPSSKHPVESNGFDVGGLITSSKSDVVTKEVLVDGKVMKQTQRELQVLHPGDLYPFMRRPMFLIVESDNSFVFGDLPRYFGQPLVVLMSPLDQPSSLHPSMADQRAKGSLFTLFLHCPLLAFCYCCDIDATTVADWDRATSYIDYFLAEASQIVTRSRIVDDMYLSFMGDDFLRLLILRYIFCETFLRMHRLFRGRTHRSRCWPPMPDDLFEHPGLTHIIIDLATHFQVRGHFHDPSAGPFMAANRD